MRLEGSPGGSKGTEYEGGVCLIRDVFGIEFGRVYVLFLLFLCFMYKLWRRYLEIDEFLGSFAKFNVLCVFWDRLLSFWWGLTLVLVLE